jgi:hypothetical protein
VKIILGISEDENGQRTPFFVLPDGVIRSFTEGWALFSYIFNISPSKIEVEEDISCSNSGIITYSYHYFIERNEFILEIPSDIDLQGLEEKIQDIIYSMKRTLYNTDENKIADIKEKLERIDNVTINIVSFSD